MMKRILSVLLALLTISGITLIFSGCADESTKEYPVVIGEDTVSAEPKNIVVLNDDFADIISYMRYDVKMVGRSVSCSQDFLSVVPVVGSSEYPNIDLIRNYETDLVIADETLSPSSRNELESAGVTVVTFPYVTSFDEMKTVYSDLGAVLGGNITGRQKGEDAYEDMIETLSSFKKTVSGVIKTVAYLYMDENGRLCTFTKGSMENQILSYTGALDIFANQESPDVDPAQLKMGTPTYIFYDDEMILSYLREDEALSTLSALTSGRTYRITLRDISRHGTTLTDTIYTMINVMFVQSETEPATPDEMIPGETLGELTPPDESSEDAEEEDEDDSSDEDENNLYADYYAY